MWGEKRHPGLLAENRFFSSVVRIQTDRGHMVCDSVPYRIVRHPSYAGSILALPGIVLALGSVWTIIPVIIALIIAVIQFGKIVIFHFC